MQLSEQDRTFLKGYDASAYDRPSVSADTLLFRLSPDKGPRKLQILLIRRKRPPYAGGWALPGGFCDPDENLAACAARELAEETGLEARYYGQCATYSRPERDPRTRVITTSHLAILPHGAVQRPRAADDAAEAQWLDLDFKLAAEGDRFIGPLVLRAGAEIIRAEILIEQDGQGRWQRRQTADVPNLAFDHAELIAAGISALRDKLYRTDLPFQMLPPVFQLQELQYVFEAVLGEELLRSTFIAYINHKLIRTSDADAGLSVMEQEYRYDAQALFHTAPFDIWL